MTTIESNWELLPAALPSAMAESQTLQSWAQDNLYSATDSSSLAFFKTTAGAKDFAPSTNDHSTTSGGASAAADAAVKHILGDFKLNDERPAPAASKEMMPAQAVEAQKGKYESCFAGAPQAGVRTDTTGTIDFSTFSTVGKAILAKIDTGHTGLITQAQLGAALQDPQFKGQDAQVLTAMYSNFDVLHNLSRHEWAWNTDTINAADLDNFQGQANDRMQLVREAAGMKDWAHANLSRFTEGGSRLTRGCIDDALAQSSLNSTDRQMLELIKSHFSDMNSYYNFIGLSVDYFDAYDKNVNSDATATMVGKVFGSCYGVSEGAQTAGICTDLYNDKDALKSITPDAIKQGHLGDCYYEAAVAALAKTDPALIRDSIKDNHDGTYTVTFRGASNEPITVKAPTEAELGQYNHGSQFGIWASVLEKAYGQYRANHGHAGKTPQEGAEGGGQPGPVFKLLTGKDSTVLQVEDTEVSQMALALKSACENHKAIATGINADSTFWWLIGMSTDKTSDNFYKQHEYTIEGFESDGKGGGTVIIRNPWGGGENSVDGRIRIDVATFMKNFSDVTILQ